MTFRDYVLEILTNQGDSTVKQIWESLPPAGRKDMTRQDVHNAMEEMKAEGLVASFGRHYRKNTWK